MRSLGDLQWLHDYIGIPYQINGRNRKGLDCYGFVKLIYSEQYQLTLPDWLIDEIDFKGTAETIDSVVCSGEFTEVERPRDGDFVICYRTKLAHHVGLFYGGGVIHCTNGTGVVYEHLSKFQRRYVRVIFGEWRP